MKDVGRVLQAKKEYQEAEKWFRESLSLTRRIPAIQDQIPYRLLDLVILFRETGNLDEADKLAREALATKVMKPLTRARVQIQLGMIMLRHKKHKEAEPLLRECLRIRQQAWAKGHWLIENAKSLLGESLAGQARFAEAEPMLLEAWEALQGNPSAIPKNYRKIRIQEALARIVNLYETWGAAAPGKGYTEKAAEWHAKLTQSPSPP